jgi:peptidyl-prolyl cis-trans isomerase D
LGSENRVIGIVTSLKTEEVAGPIQGVSGVFMVQVISRTEASLSTDIASFRRQLSAAGRTSIDNRLMEAIRNSAKIKDNRYSFY